MATPAEAAIYCADLRKAYGRIVALKGLTLSVPRHSIFGLLGPNGAGKSTLLKLLTRQIAPTGGQAWVAGAPISGRSTDVRSRIGYLSEQPAFYPWMQGDEMLDFVGQLCRLSPPVYRKRRAELLELVGLKDAARRRIGGYSHGMRQRLGIAQALMNAPEVLFLDEPVSALDPSGRKEILELFSSLRGQATIFFSSHILADVDRVCDEVAVLNQGILLTQAATTALKERYARPMIALELGTQADVLSGLGEQERWVQSVAISGTRASIAVTDLETATRALPAAIARSGLPLLRYEVAIPTLEEVFVQLLSETADQEA
ncbi:MAG TPA: ABC transporter ATP-binding protein [Ktedonobacteraceae bacterium]|jgi:ABC-2 type transport system ATP-binding protein